MDYTDYTDFSEADRRVKGIVPAFFIAKLSGIQQSVLENQ